MNTMPGDEVARVIQAFGAVVEETAGHTYGSPERLLPYPREAIKAALRHVYLSTDDPATLDRLQQALIHLGHFFAEPEGSIAEALAGAERRLQEAAAALMAKDPAGQQRFREAAALFAHAERLGRLILTHDRRAMKEIDTWRAAKGQLPAYTSVWLPRVTLDMNCVIDLEEERVNTPHVRELLRRHNEGLLHLRVPAIGASERKPGGVYAENFSEFQEKLAAVGLDEVELLKPPLVLDMTFLDWSIVIDEVMERELKKIQSALFPAIPYDYGDYCAMKGIERTPPIDRDWRNARCDVIGIWSHIHHGGDVFVTADRKFLKSKRPALSELGAGAIVHPADAGATVESLEL